MRIQKLRFLFLFLLVSYSSTADTFDDMRSKWFNFLTANTGVPVTSTTAQSYWTSMNKSASRTYLWSSYTFDNSADITSSYVRLSSLAKAYKTPNSSLYNNATLKSDIISALQWIYTNHYNENLPAGERPIPANGSNIVNWWDFQIGAPTQLNDIVVLLYNDLSSTDKTNYMNVVDEFAHDFTQCYVSTCAGNFTGANRVWISNVIAVRGIIIKSAARIQYASDELSPVFLYAAPGSDGFHQDGSFIQHQTFAYTGGYGISLLSSLAEELYILYGSAYYPSDPNLVNIRDWIYNSYAPIIFKGGLMSNTMGREIARSNAQEHDKAREAAEAVALLASFAPAADQPKLKGLVKAWVADGPNRQSAPAYQQRIDAIMNDASIGANTGQEYAYRQFANMDRVVQRRPNYAFGVSIYSNRTQNYETRTGYENIKGWHTGDGMTYLYTSDTAQFNSNYWPTVNMYRLPGTTVVSGSEVAGYKYNNKSFAGGASLLDRYGVTGLDFDPVSQNQSGKKSYFMFDGKIVCLGAAIVTSGTVQVDTYMENRKLSGNNSNVFVVNGLTQPSTMSAITTFANAKWAHLEVPDANSDIGYYFPTAFTLNMLRKSYSGAWKDINVNQNATVHTRNYLMFWKNHGVNATNTGSDDNRYEYVLLPGYSKAQTQAFSASPTISVLANTSVVQAARDNTAKIIGANFWPATGGSLNVENITAYLSGNKPCSIIMKQSRDSLYVSVSDPTMENTGTITINIKETALSTISKDANITVSSLGTISFTVSVNALRGKSSNIVFKVPTSALPQYAAFSEHAVYTTNANLIGQSNPGGTDWTAHPTYPVANGNPITISSTAQTFTGYTSGANSIRFKFPAATGEAATIKFPADSPIIIPALATKGTVYASFLINVSRSMSNNSHFLSFATNTGTIRARVYVKRNTVPGLSFGVGHNTTSTSNAFTAASKIYPVNTPLLVVVKYERTGTSTSDKMSLYVFDPANGVPPPSEPATADAVYTEVSPFNKPDIDGITILQPARNSGESTNVDLWLDGLNVDTSWGNTVKATASALRVAQPASATSANADGLAVAVSPNPVKAGDMHLKIAGSTTGNIDITLTSILGLVTKKITYTAEETTAELAVPVKDLAPGLYIITVQQADKVVQTKVLIE